MTQHATAKLAWSLWGLSIALTALFVLLVFVSRTGPGPLEYDSAPLGAALYAALVLIFSTLGALIAARQPGNAVGWLSCSTGVVLATGLCTQLYADYALFSRPESISGGELAAWAASWLLPVGLFVTPVVLLSSSFPAAVPLRVGGESCFNWPSQSRC
ncbi:MAG: hypothetical protein H0V97_05965 [Actinobacteria bacterium]|nr:hypothetical protein [Actinomycetota bacterium]